MIWLGVVDWAVQLLDNQDFAFAIAQHSHGMFTARDGWVHADDVFAGIKGLVIPGFFFDPLHPAERPESGKPDLASPADQSYFLGDRNLPYSRRSVMDRQLAQFA